MTPNGGFKIELLNKAIITSISTGSYIAGSNVPPIKAHIFNDQHLQRSLISMSDITNLGYTVELSVQNLKIKLNGNTILTTDKEPDNKLWTMPITNTSSCNWAVHHQPNAEYISFIHATYGSPPIKTLLDAVKKGYLRTVPRITTRMITLNPPVSDATAKGHLDLNRQHRKAVRSTTYQSPSEIDVSSGLSDNVTESSIFSVSDVLHRHNWTIPNHISQRKPIHIIFCIQQLHSHGTNA